VRILYKASVKTSIFNMKVTRNNYKGSTTDPQAMKTSQII